jgi:predicted RNA polymerase sigma factor
LVGKWRNKTPLETPLRSRIRSMGRDEQARAARLQALDLTHNQAERALLCQRLLL